MQAMTTQEEGRQLDGFVQIDDAYLGGERNGGERGRGSENKQPFVIAVETDASLEHPRYAVIEPLRTFDNSAIIYACADRKCTRLYSCHYFASLFPSSLLLISLFFFSF